MELTLNQIAEDLETMRQISKDLKQATLTLVMTKYQQVCPNIAPQVTLQCDKVCQSITKLSAAARERLMKGDSIQELSASWEKQGNALVWKFYLKNKPDAPFELFGQKRHQASPEDDQKSHHCGSGSASASQAGTANPFSFAWNQQHVNKPGLFVFGFSKSMDKVTIPVVVLSRMSTKCIVDNIRLLEGLAQTRVKLGDHRVSAHLSIQESYSNLPEMIADTDSIFHPSFNIMSKAPPFFKDSPTLLELWKDHKDRIKKEFHCELALKLAPLHIDVSRALRQGMVFQEALEFLFTEVERRNKDKDFLETW
jgi:hypothetical protein